MMADQRTTDQNAKRAYDPTTRERDVKLWHLGKLSRADFVVVEPWNPQRPKDLEEMWPSMQDWPEGSTSWEPGQKHSRLIFGDGLETKWPWEISCKRCWMNDKCNKKTKSFVVERVADHCMRDHTDHVKRDDFRPKDVKVELQEAGHTRVAWGSGGKGGGKRSRSPLPRKSASSGAVKAEPGVAIAAYEADSDEVNAVLMTFSRAQLLNNLLMREMI